MGGRGRETNKLRSGVDREVKYFKNQRTVII
jgi:hypothetical protein